MTTMQPTIPIPSRMDGVAINGQYGIYTFELSIRG